MPTTTDIAAYADAWRSRASREAERQSLQVDDDTARARAAVASLRDQFAFDAAWLFGSRAAGRSHEASDWDIAVRGLPLRDWFSALERLEQEFGVEKVDLVRTEEAGIGLRMAIERGVVLDG